MLALQAVPADKSSGPMIIQPKVKGKYRWMGTATLTFIPDQPLPYSTSFTIIIPAGTASLKGNKLKQEIKWTFETPRPLVTWSSPDNNQDHIDTITAILVRFNQPVSAAEIAKKTSILIKRNNQPDIYPNYTSRQATTTDNISNPEQVVIFNSKVPFGMDTRVIVTIKDGALGQQGQLGMVATHTFSFTTFGELKFLGIQQKSDEIYPQSGITLLFSNGVTSRDVMNALSFTPSMKTREEYYENTYPSPQIYIPLPLLPDSNYSGVIKAGLRDQFGNILRNDGSFSIHVQSYQPFVRTRTGIGILEGYESHKFPVTTMNMDSFRVQMGSVDPNHIIPLMRKLTWDYYDQIALEEGTLLTPRTVGEDVKEFARAKTVPTRSKHNVICVRPLNLDDVLGKDGRGVAFVQVDDMNREKTAYLKTLVQVTNYGITAKFSPESNLIWVTNLKDASPVSHASLEIRDDSNKVYWTGTTDDNGLAKTPGWGKLKMAGITHSYGGEDDESDGETSQPRQWVIVRKGAEVAFTSSEWNEGIQPYRFDLNYDWNAQPVKYEGVLFTDRGLYKASERVDIKGIVRVRTESSWKIISSLKMRLSIKNSRNEEVYNQAQKLSPFGSFSANLMLKPNSPLGNYSMVLEYQVQKTGKTKWKQLGYQSFRVEAFRLAEFEVIAKYNKERYIIGDTISGFLTAKYLFGAPIKDVDIKWRLTASRGSFVPPGFDGYYFGTMGWLTRFQQNFQSRELQNIDTVLDEFGTVQVKSPLRVGELQGTISLMLEGEVTSPTRQTLTGRTTVMVHGGEYYLGIRPSSTFVKCDSTMEFSLITASPDGKLLPNQSLKLNIYERVWHSVRKAETGGRFSWYSTPADSLIDSCTVLTTEKPIIREFVPKNPGFYYVDVAGSDKRGNALRAQTYFYATGSGYVAWERSNNDRIDLVADKTSLQPGETVSIIVKNPYETATALVTVEREGILRHFTTTLTGSAPQINLPIIKDYLPNVFVSVVLLQGRTDRPTAREEGDVGRPSFKVGYVALSVNPKIKKLNVSIESGKKEYRPGDTVEVKINTKDINGKPKSAEVTLSVADLGVLSLIGYRMPDPFETFYSEQGLAVVTTETRMHIIEQRSYDEKGQEVGGGGAAVKTGLDVPDADGIRKNFLPSAYWNPTIRTNGQGYATVKFKLPDNLTAFEMMGVAHTKESDFGYGENSLTVTKPLLLQPSLPRFARVGDKFKSGVVIMNYSEKGQSITLTTTVQGLKWNHQDTTSYTLQPGQAKEVLFDFEAEKIGTAKFIFRARSENNNDGLQWTIPITAPRLRESVALSESTEDPNIEEHIIPPADAFSDAGDVEITAASTAMVGLSGGISYLFHYPYGCLEQRSSSILPMILAKDMVEAFHFEVLKNRDYREVVSKTLDEISLFQHSNGGFSYWKNEGPTCTYISAFAMYTLAQAQRNGYQIDKNTFSQGLEYLKRVLRGEERDYYFSTEVSQTTRSLILYTLALAGKPEFGYMENLYNERTSMPLFAKGYLLRALHAAKGNSSMMDDLARDLINRAKISPTSAHFEERNDYNLWWCFDSNTRTTALIMQALVETQPTNSLIPKVVRWLIDEQRIGRWRTTQENVYVVDALATYMRAYEKDEPNFHAAVALEGKTILNEFFKGRTFRVASSTIPFSQLTLGKNYPVRLTKDGPGRLYYGLRMNYYPKGETQAKDEGYSIVKTIAPLDGTAADTYNPGTMMKVTLTVSSNQDRHFMVVEDPVPAGMEVVNTSFQTTAANLGKEERENENLWYEQVFQHVEKYDDRVVLFGDYFTAGSHTYTYLVQITRSGSYQMPATHAEGMYEPEVFGQTGSKIIIIK
jgi:uncharacterized protein YfaS (alpha-2-macroglobulin family)